MVKHKTIDADKKRRPAQIKRLKRRLREKENKEEFKQALCGKL